MERSPAGGVGRLVLATFLVAGSWLGVYALFTQVFPDDTVGGSAYRYRDDALITLSHARGLVDIGSVSVGVSGSRVEGYSTPLQFGVAAAYYALGGDGHRGFLDVQVAVSTLVLGAAVFALLRLANPRRRLLPTASVAVGIAVGLFATYAFFGWHSSGMENALTNALAAVAVAALALASSIRRRWVLPVAGVVVALFALSRVEFVFHAVPLLLVTCLFLIRRSPREHRWRRVGLLVGPAAGIWLAVLMVRFWYFGDVAPNTAEAQGISPGDNVRAWVDVLWPLLPPVAYGTVVALRRRRLEIAVIARTPGFAIVAAAGLVSAGVLAHGADAQGELPGWEALLHVMRVLGLWWWVALVGALALLVRGRLGPVEALLATLVATGTAHVLVFGPARLASERVVTFVLVPLACLAGVLALRIDPARVVPASKGATGACLTAAGGLTLVAVGGAWSNHDSWGAQQPLCCDLTPTIERTLAAASSMERRTELPVVSVANADLGLLSIQKQVNVTDLGGLGDPLLARVWRRGQESGRVDVAVDYLNRYASPDVVELHGIWSCAYAPWQSSEHFRAAYEKVWDDGWTAAWARDACPGLEGVEGGIWVRADLRGRGTSAEVELSRALAADPEPATVRRELAVCRSSVASSCQYVTRSVYRNLRAFDDAGKLDQTIATFSRSPTADYDQALLRSRTDGDWYEQAADSLFDRH